MKSDLITSEELVAELGVRDKLRSILARHGHTVENRRPMLYSRAKFMKALASCERRRAGQ